MNNEMFQQIFDLILPTLPDGWKKMILYVGYTSGSYTMKFYTRDVNGVYTDCFSQKDSNKVRLIKLFMSIDNIIGKERNNEKDRWSVMTMIVDNGGNMKTEFDYADISENSIQYERKWKEKYIV